ncbi:HNH endonuclease signature motif containing protein [Phyllobacterium lublinensis]|uniref:HNH endonuclease signature motif containing protein n=1 Tax=Phyllobacterium lublinensis TaxID=2875708 RepID=UPI001CCE946C|nr:HNH endonuclease signature motif containing protein [Phyllobacterium sp. 2063]MBZ9653505.1 HNH endonuclease [Phyllobacterium sp. 2063]
MARKSFNQKDRARIFSLRAGVCHLCNGKVDGVREAWEIEHEIPWAISRDDSDENLQVAHVKCHREKTATDMGDIAKVKRVAAKHTGTYPKSKAKIRSRGFVSTRG